MSYEMDFSILITAHGIAVSWMECMNEKETIINMRAHEVIFNIQDGTESWNKLYKRFVI